jgi:hypothetical protein
MARWVSRQLSQHHYPWAPHVFCNICHNGQVTYVTKHGCLIGGDGPGEADAEDRARYRGGNDESNYPKPNRSAGRHSDEAQRRLSLSDSKGRRITQQFLRYRSVRLSQKPAGSPTQTQTHGDPQLGEKGTHT